MFKKNHLILLVYAFIPILVINLYINQDQQFVFLAYSFLTGHLDVNFAKNTIGDLSFYKGNYYWPSGPFPAVLLAPFVSLGGTNFLQGIVQFPLNVLNFVLVYKICRLNRLEEKKSLLLSIFFIFGSIYTPVGTIPFSWYFAQVISTTLLLISILIFLRNRNYFLIGTLLGFATLTRLSLVFASVFFLIFILSENAPVFKPGMRAESSEKENTTGFSSWNFMLKKKESVLNFLKLILPIITAIVLVATYNYARFDNFFEDGHKYQVLFPDLDQKRAEGIFSTKHILPNTYNLLFKPPELVFDESAQIKFPYIKFSNWGLSIFILSPVLLTLFKTDFKTLLTKASILTIALISIPVLSYFGNGWRQIGYRYALDFFPFVLLLLTSAVKDVSTKKLITLISLGILITWFFILEKLSGF